MSFTSKLIAVQLHCHHCSLELGGEIQYTYIRARARTFNLRNLPRALLLKIRGIPEVPDCVCYFQASVCIMIETTVCCCSFPMPDELYSLSITSGCSSNRLTRIDFPRPGSEDYSTAKSWLAILPLLSITIICRHTTGQVNGREHARIPRELGAWANNGIPETAWERYQYSYIYRPEYIIVGEENWYLHEKKYYLLRIHQAIVKIFKIST